MSEGLRIMLTMILLPVTWVLVQRFLCLPITSVLRKYGSARWIKILTHAYCENKRCQP